MGLLPAVRGGGAGSRTQAHLPHPRWCKCGSRKRVLSLLYRAAGKAWAEKQVSSPVAGFPFGVWGRGVDKVRCSMVGTRDL